MKKENLRMIYRIVFFLLFLYLIWKDIFLYGISFYRGWRDIIFNNYLLYVSNTFIAIVCILSLIVFLYTKIIIEDSFKTSLIATVIFLIGFVVPFNYMIISNTFALFIMNVLIVILILLLGTFLEIILG